MVGVSLRVSWTLGSICGAFRSRVTLSRNRTSKLFNCPPRARRRRASEADRCSTYLRETEQTDCGELSRWESAGGLEGLRRRARVACGSLGGREGRCVSTEAKREATDARNDGGWNGTPPPPERC